MIRNLLLGEYKVSMGQYGVTGVSGFLLATTKIESTFMIYIYIFSVRSPELISSIITHNNIQYS